MDGIQNRMEMIEERAREVKDEWVEMIQSKS